MHMNMDTLMDPEHVREGQVEKTVQSPQRINKNGGEGVPILSFQRGQVAQMTLRRDQQPIRMRGRERHPRSPTAGLADQAILGVLVAERTATLSGDFRFTSRDRRDEREGVDLTVRMWNRRARVGARFSKISTYSTSGRDRSADVRSAHRSTTRRTSRTLSDASEASCSGE